MNNRREFLGHVFNAGVAGAAFPLLAKGSFVERSPFAANPRRPSGNLLANIAGHIHDNALIGFEEGALLAPWHHENRTPYFLLGDQIDVERMTDIPGVGLLDYADRDVRHMMHVHVPSLHRSRPVPIITVAWIQATDAFIHTGIIIGRTAVQEPATPVLDYIRHEDSRYLA